MYLIEKEDQLNKYLSYAVGLHILILLLFISVNYILDINPVKIAIKKEVEMVQTAVRVDLVGLPRHTLKELEKIDLAAVQKDDTPEEKNTQNNETSEVEFKKVKKKIDMKSLLSGYSEKKVVQKKQRKNLKINNLKNIILEGNKLSQGSSTTGEMVDETQQDFVRYIQSLPDRVRPNWKLPSYLLEKDLRCRVRIYLAASGKISNMEIFESSGDEEYDQKALIAIKRSSPLPKPDAKILGRVVAGDVILGFPL